MTDLDKLIEAVEGGEVSMSQCASAFPSESAYGVCTWHHAWAAYHGSLDAAKALHDELLPGCRVDNISQHDNGLWWVTLHRRVQGDELGNVTVPSVMVAAFDKPTPARAWLIAILKAYRAQVHT